MGRQYKVLSVSEGALGTLFLGSSSLPIPKMEAALNEHGAQGWEVSCLAIEKKRLLLFWQRETAVIVLSRLV